MQLPEDVWGTKGLASFVLARMGLARSVLTMKHIIGFEQPAPYERFRVERSMVFAKYRPRKSSNLSPMRPHYAGRDHNFHSPFCLLICTHRFKSMRAFSAPSVFIILLMPNGFCSGRVPCPQLLQGRTQVRILCT